YEQLSGQERRILELITQGMTNREISEEMSLAEKTVRNYVSNLLMKLGMSHRTQVAAYGARLLAKESQNAR
ncbi:MAG: response regulator transcription factor, partial [Acidimicrobiales bacterium]